MKKIRFGITGSGYMGRTHAEAILHHRDTAELVAIWGGSRAGDLAKRCGAAFEPTLEGLMRRPDIDAVVITTPHFVHHREVMLALEGGKHALIEKPMTLRVDHCEEIIATARRRGLTIAVAHNLRYRINLPIVRQIVRSGAIGRVQSMHYSMIRQLANVGNFGGNKNGWVNAPEALGFVVDALPHGIDAMRWATGVEFRRAAGFCKTFSPGRAIEDTTVGIFETADGAVCSVHITQASHGDYHGEMARLSIIGSKGSLDMDGFGKLHQTDRERGWRFVAEQPPVMADDPESAFKIGRMLAFQNQIGGFLDLMHGRPSDIATGEDGRAGIAASLALMTSSAEGRLVTIS